MDNKEKTVLRKKMVELFGESYMKVSDLMVEYHKRPPVEPTKEEWKEWLEGLKEPMKSDFREKGFEKCKTILSFRRYYQEKNDYGMRDFMRDNLSKEDFEYYMKMEKTRPK